MDDTQQTMAGRTVLVTGASDGIGAEAARVLHARGAHVLVTGRSADKLRPVAEAVGTEPLVADFSRLDDVRRLGSEVAERTDRLDVLMNNAGGTFSPKQRTPDGHEPNFQVNHLAPYLLTRLLLDRLVASAPARIVTTASDAHEFGPIDPDDYMSTAKYRPMKVYGRSKLANILMTTELAHLLEGTGVTATCFHPGFVATSIGRDHVVGRAFVKLATPFIKSPVQGADTGLWLATTDEATNGGYYVKRRPHAVKNDGQDPKLAQRLWEDSAALVGLS